MMIIKKYTEVVKILQILIKSILFEAHSYVVNGLEDNVSYEVRVTATNHLGTSEMSNLYLASTTINTPPVMSEYKLINRPTR